ncbi:MAG: adenosylmethionine decarboxylase [Pseudomonadota bacterium]
MHTHPVNPGLGGTDTGFALGRQVTIDYYDCHPDRLLDPDYLEKAFVGAAKFSGATVIDSSFHAFAPQGVSGVVTIAESHFTVHAWPEHNYAAVDIFTCGDSIDIDVAIDSLKQSLDSGKVVISTDRNRGIIPNLFEVEPSGSCMKNPGLYPISWKKVYEEIEPWGVLASIDVHGCDPAIIRDIPATTRFVHDLCTRLGIEGKEKCQVARIGEGESAEGFSITRIIGPSFISGHFVTGTNTAYIDIFCCDYYEPRTMAEFATAFFKGSNYKLQLALRR